MSSYTYEIQVKQEHIDNSQRGCNHCPIALAISEFFNTPVAVGRVSVNFKAFTLHHVRLSKAAQEFIYNFDKLGKEAVQPFTFKITLTAKHIDALT